MVLPYGGMDVFKFCAAVVFSLHVCDVTSDCVLTLKKDFGSPSPVFLRDGGYMRPSAGGAISFRRSETVLIACPGDRRHIVLGNTSMSYSNLEAHCIINSTFRVNRWIGPFKDIRCNSQPWFTTEDTRQPCAKNSRIHRVGYNIKGVMHSLYEACFDEYLIHTYYVKHSVTPTSRYMQAGLARPAFIEGSLFGKVKMSALYKAANQKRRLDEILGGDTAGRYISKKQFLTRGHLAARADYTLGAETRATFHYVNTAPQWIDNNAGDWGALEESVRHRVQTLNITVTVFTGGHGEMTLPDARGEHRQMYLGTDANNNGIVPVPMYLFKVVYEQRTKKAVAFVTINSSFYNSSMINDLSFCDDVCDANPKFSWLTWRHRNGVHSFCCEYGEFASKIDYLPKIDVEGLFY